MKRCPLTLLVLAAVLSLSACGPQPPQDIAGSLDQALKDQSATSVNISGLSEFDWDALYIFGPYAPPAFICATLGFDQPKCEAAQFASPDEGEFLLIFVRNNEIAQHEILSRGVADFALNSVAQPIPRTKATFTIIRSAGGNILACEHCPPEENRPQERP